MRLTLVISSLDSGGAERVMATLANHWAGTGHQVTLITIMPSGPDFYKIDSSVNRIRLSTRGRIRSRLRYLGRLDTLLKLREAIIKSDADVVISFVDLTNILTLLATIGMRVPVIVSERTDPRYHRLTLAQRGLRYNCYRRASALVLQTQALSSWGRSIVPAGRLRTIPNPVRPSGAKLSARATQLPVPPFVVAVGRLEPEKGFEILVRAFARSRQKHEDWSLVILGKGTQEEHLKQLAKELGVAPWVWFPGTVEDIDWVYRRSQLFVLSSIIEGFPNALLEAMAAGVAVIATDCPSGPREIITHEVDGLLVRPNDVDSLRSAMERLMSDEALAQGLADRARVVRERFSLDTIGQKWEELFASLPMKR